MQLEAVICDVWGDPLEKGVIVHTTEGAGLQITEPLNDARTASLTISMDHPAAKHAKPLSRVLSVTYGPFLIFKGPIIMPSFDFAAGTITLNAHDPTIKLKHHYHRYGDYVVDNPYPIDGTGMRMLVESSVPIEPQVDRGVPGNGILWGDDSTTPQPPAEEDGLWRRPVERGSNVWESVQNLSQLLVGPDFRFRPVDSMHPGVGGQPEPSFFCELDTADKLGADKTALVIFEHGTGTDNAENVMYEPDGDVVRNWFAQVYPGGERNREDVNRKAVVHHENSQDKYGIYQGWESSGQRDPVSILEEKAKAWVKAYHEPPDFFTVVPRPDDHPSVPRYGFDYEVGDEIRARAHKWKCDIDIVGRIVSATISAYDQSGNVRVALECVPNIGTELGMGGEDDID